MTIQRSLLVESKNKSIVFTFGRMNPPTKAHEKLIKSVAKYARKNNSDHAIFISKTHDRDKNPLSWEYRKRILERMFPGVLFSSNKDINTPMKALYELGKWYDDVTMIVGGDRAKEFEKKLIKYAPEWGIKKYKLINIGDRNDDTSDISLISASMARKFAREGEFEQFKELMPTRMTGNMIKDIYERIRGNVVDEDADNKEADKYREWGLKSHFIYSGWG